MSRVTIVETNLVFRTPLRPRQATRRFTAHWTGVLPAGFDLAKITMPWIHDIHIRERGWAGVGYHYLINADAEIERGRPRWAVGAHDEGQNADSIGICIPYIVVPTADQVAIYCDLMADLHDLYGLIPDNTTMDGHRDNEPPETATECPGDALYEMLPGIRARVRGLCGL